MQERRYLFIVKESLTGPGIEALDLFELSMCERHIDVGNHYKSVVATREIAVEIAERFLERHVKLIEGWG